MKTETHRCPEFERRSIEITQDLVLGSGGRLRIGRSGDSFNGWAVAGGENSGRARSVARWADGEAGARSAAVEAGSEGKQGPAPGKSTGPIG